VTAHVLFGSFLRGRQAAGSGCGLLLKRVLGDLLGGGQLVGHDETPPPQFLPGDLIGRGDARHGC
jgi:hypothetical protein